MILFQRNSEESQPRTRRGGCMRSCLITFIIYVLICGLCGWLFEDLYDNPTVSLEPNSIYHLKMEGTLVEQAPEENPFMDMMSEIPGYEQPITIGLDDILSNIRLAKTDDNIKGIYLDGGQLALGQASAKAIRDALLDFKSSGKWIIAYAQQYSQTNYYIASVADKIYVNPVGTIAWHGFCAQKLYYTRLLEKIGVDMQIVKVGTFKSAVEPFFLTKMSDADRLQTQKYVSGLWSVLRAEVSESRHISESELDALADRYMDLQPSQAYIQSHLADGLVYTEDMDSIFRDWMGTKDFHKVSHANMSHVSRPTSNIKDEVAVIYAEGNITDTQGDGIVGKDMVKLVSKLRKNEHVKAVVLRVNSGGGSADASEQIWHAMTTLQQQGIPVVVSMGDYAASGGYYISCGADYIYAQPNTLTGSIGIFGTIPNLKGIRDKVGIDVDDVSTHAHSDLEANMIYQGMNPAERALMQQMVERGYDLFTSRCAQGRGMTQEAIKCIGEGRVWLGTDALELGLVDELGNLDDAVIKAASLAGVESYTIQYYPEKKSFLDEMLESMDTSSEEEKMVARIREFASQSRVMALMPQVEIQ